MALGRVLVQSALGEPLRAEIDVPEITTEEASSLRVNLGSSEAFRAAGIDASPALSGLQVSLQRRPDGRAFLRLTGSRPVSEPFVDLIVEASWSSGRVVRDYTLLFDPPAQRAARPQPAPLTPGVAAPAPTQRSTPAPVAQAPAPAAAAPAPRPQAAAPVAAPSPAVPAAPSSAGGQVKVKQGDTAGGIAAANRPASVSLDQMLVAMLRANPGAFTGGNVNRLRSGSVLDLPGAAEAGAIDATEARQTIAAQSRDFNEFRRRLAGTVPQAAVGAADRQTSGRVQAEVREPQAAAPAADKLTLSKDAAGKAAAEEKIARERQAKEAATRTAELSRNIDELAKLGVTTAPAATPAAPPAAAPAPAPTSTPEPAVAATSPAETAPATPAAPAPAEAAPAVPTASAPVAEPAPATPAVAAPVPAPISAPPADEPSFISQFTENPLALPAAGGLLALLAGLGLYRLRQRKANANVDSSFLESRLQPDSFFGSSGGQRIDTAEAAASGSSMVYSPSQLDAAGDVDPVAEADVYLAYGRDLQAEEILKEAMRTSPTRVAIHVKLLEIYAKRRDARAFEVVAAEAFGLTSGQGTEWEHACELGRDLDPSNPLYQPGGAPPARSVAAAAATAAGALNTMPFASSTQIDSRNQTAPAGLDLDLDFSLDEPDPAPTTLPPAMSAALEPDELDDGPISNLDDLDSTETLTKSPSPAPMSMDFDLDFDAPAMPAAAAAATASEPSNAPLLDMSDLDLPEFELDEVPSTPAPAAAPVAELMNFDLDGLNLDLDTPVQAGSSASANEPDLTEENPLETKLSLAEEFRAIGDLEGARSLAEEVLAEASGMLKTKASSFLSDLT